MVVRTCSSVDTIALYQNITDGETIVSDSETYELGFFSPGTSKNRYLEIWFYKTSPQKVVWVANRETPLTNTLGIVKLDMHGILSLVDGGGTLIWSSNSSTYGTYIVNPVAQLLDTGNLVIKNGNFVSNGIFIWQSFDYPGDTLISGMKMGKNLITGREMYLTSWRSADDPSQGEYTVSTGFLLMLIATPSGKIETQHLNLRTRRWEQVHFTLPLDNCDKYELCGSYGSCSIETSPICGCLKGFELTNLKEWSLDKWNSGCRRSRDLNCGPGEGFFRYSSMKLPDTHDRSAVFNGNMTLQECEIACKNNCLCTAYADPNITRRGVGCLHWFGDLIDVRVYQQNRQDLFVRLAASELLFKVLIEDHYSSSKEGNIEVPLFSLSTISRATNNFSIDNKLGEGGFGLVYKGVLEEGQEIAVKRLSKSSRQGLDEFKNEVICIAKLQHRNLVKLLGYCVQGDETMLIYEYMPNKSLDWFIFDDSRKSLLDWPQRFHIIHGIARGLLYLHQDSRLRVVHRDLKAGNILLDHDMNPKISDFSLARMFKGHESEANTKKVVGTLGYISLEYAANGLFSVKSDIFSFGILVLETAWRLYKDGKSLDLIDTSVGKSWSCSEVLRSIHIALLCVQQRAEDRPNIRSVVHMLGSEGSLPSPKEPGFFIQGNKSSFALIISSPLSVNGVTLSQIDGG
ncbi:Apple-like protein [Cynara cardunculus var. scolymus]|uniref:non-specific serine/threonine protein kinase n=1 Tax=Cynara cardunculus var. scolymus TaxID=59895 RepID=A0A118K2V5_CYNCS|nr:Apple-like protein [Cynara cardunculus var. scolymus]